MTETDLVHQPYPPYVGFYLTGKNLDPQKITERLQMSPHLSFKRGDSVENTTKTRPNGLWMLDSSVEVHSDSPIIHLEWIINKIEPIKEILAEILGDSTINKVISLFWVMPSEHEELVFEPMLLKQLSNLGVKFELSIYS